MIVKVTGGSKLQRELVREIAQFVHKKYTPRHTSIEVAVSIRKVFDDEGVVGYCWPLQTHRPREFEMQVESTSTLDDFIKTVIHEFVHVKQYVKGELVDGIRGCASVKWNGKDHTRTPYSNHPWELQAYNLQESLYNEFMGKSK